MVTVVLSYIWILMTIVLSYHSQEIHPINLVSRLTSQQGVELVTPVYRTVTLKSMDVEGAVKQVFCLYERHGSGDYLGEPVNLTGHMIQCAVLAEQDGQPLEVVLAAFLHDIGHLVGTDKGLRTMITDGTNLGAMDHDVLGGQFLRKLGYPDKVCDLVQGHVQAKRYLVWKNKEYYDNLSPASKMTLEHQGGRMNTEEATAFENNPLFDLIIRMRYWDEAGKEVDVTNVHLEKYRNLCFDYLTSMR